MRLIQLSISNFTSLGNVELSDLPDLVILIGKNSSGKSNIIDAMALFMMEFGSSIEQQLGSVDEFQHLFPDNDVEAVPPPTIQVTILLEHEEAAGLFGFRNYSNDDTEREGYANLFGADAWDIDEDDPVELCAAKSLSVDGDSITWKTSYLRIGSYLLEASGPKFVDEDEIQFDGDISDQSDQIEGIDANSFIARLDEFLRYRFQVIHTTENPRNWTSRFSERPTIIDAEHVEALWSLHQSRGIQRRPWAEVSRLYETIAPNEQRPVGVSNSIQLEEGPLTIPIGMAGEGSQAVLRLIDKIQRSIGLIAVEEPETHLHPGLAKRVGQLLSESASANKQIFVTTHSPFLVDRESLDRCFLVRKTESHTNVSPMSDKDDLRTALFELGIRPSDVLFSDAILLVEGFSDDIFVGGLSNLLGVPLISRHVRVICAHGKDRGKYKINLWSELASDAQLPIYLMLDQDASDEAEEAIDKGRLVQDRCLVLAKGDLEDYYPWEVLSQTLEEDFNVHVPDPIPVGQRVASLRKILGRKGEHRNAWKPPLAEGIVRRLDDDIAEDQLGEIADFLRKIWHELSSS